MAFNNYDDVSKVPYQIFLYLLKNKSVDAENLWKALAYDDAKALSHKNLTTKEKRDLIWKGETQEDGFKLFNKPVIADAMTTANSSVQLRIFRYGLIPSTRLSGIALFEFDTYTNDKTACLLDEDDMLVERTDYIETKLLKLQIQKLMDLSLHMKIQAE